MLYGLQPKTLIASSIDEFISNLSKLSEEVNFGICVTLQPVPISSKTTKENLK